MGLAALVCALVVVVDQVTKAWARAALASGSVTLIPGVLDLRLTFNTGAAFSMGQGAGWVFVAVALAVLAAVFWAVSTSPGMPLALVTSLACVAGGGLGNMVDRVLAGQVTDFLATAFIDFPIFNVADCFVTCGVVVSLVLFWRWDAGREADEEAMA